MIQERKYEEINLGDRAEYSRTVTQNEVLLFAGLSGDHNPIHLDADYARGTRFGQRIAHGMLSACFISTIFGTILPGKNTVYLSQELKFTKPVFLGDTVTAIARVVGKDDHRRILEMETMVVNQRDEEVIQGKARVMLPG